MRNIVIIFLVCWIGAKGIDDCAAQIAAESPVNDGLAGITNSFRAVKPSVEMDYDAAYKLMFLKYRGIARVKILLTEGVWTSQYLGKDVPACMLDFKVVPESAGKDSASISLNKNTLCILTIPDLRLLKYAKVNDEVIKPIFGSKRHVHYVETYNFEKGFVEYMHHDILAGTTITNIANLADLNTQSREVADVLKVLYAAYGDGARASGPAIQPGLRVHFNVDRVVRKFGVKVDKQSDYVPIMRAETELLYGEICPVDGSGDMNESFSIACLPFRKLANALDCEKLKSVAGAGQEWYMTPVSGRYELFIGAIECTLLSMKVLDEKVSSSLRNPAGEKVR